MVVAVHVFKVVLKHVHKSPAGIFGVVVEDVAQVVDVR